MKWLTKAEKKRLPHGEWNIIPDPNSDIESGYISKTHRGWEIHLTLKDGSFNSDIVEYLSEVKEIYKITKDEI